ncbi:MAG: hypothetical protein ABSF64_00015 [Bryobacteraceae bacterium]|jgi:hypothetical protein
MVLKLAATNPKPRWSRGRWMFGVCLCAALFLPRAAAQTFAEAPPSVAPWRVRLLAPLTTKFNRKGDMVSARVVEPAAYQGSVLEGVIREIKAGGAAGKESTIQFEFHTLHAPSEDLAVTATLVGAANSRGEGGMDETGSPLAAGSHALGGIAEAAAPQRGSSGSPRLSVRAEHLSLAPGSEFALEVKTKHNR